MVVATRRARRPDRAVRAAKAGMLLVDLGFLAYWSATVLGLVPAEYAYRDYTDPVVTDWNYSFLPLDLLASLTGLSSLALARRARNRTPAPVPARWALMLVSLSLTATAGLQAVAFWALRGDWSLAWWAPNLLLLGFPAVAIAVLVRRAAPTAG